MKNSRGVLIGLGVGLFGLLVWTPAADVFSGKLDSLAKLELVSSKDLPKHGTFWSLQRTNHAPLPFNPYPDLPVYYLGYRNSYVVDDSSVDYAAIYKQRTEARTLRKLEWEAGLISDAEYFALEGGGEMSPLSYTSSDLWLEITAFTNRTAALVIHPPASETNHVHDLFYTTNLSAPIPWRFVQRCVTTNVLVPELCDQQGFFRLGQTNGNLTVTTNVTAQQMAQLLVPPWVTVYNATNNGAVVARGTFAGGNGGGLPLESGVILSTGHITNAIGTNNDTGYIAQFNGSYLGTDSDANLDSLVGGGSTRDAAVLAFDLVATNAFVLQFQYVFASEEYPEWIGDYNDPMAIFVSTNRSGTNWIITTNNNIALVPGTNQPVTVSTINGGFTNLDGNFILPSNPQYYVDNKDPGTGYSSMPPYAATAPVFNIQYDGMSVLLTAQIQITANSTNRIKIAIEDYGDSVYDAAVFLKAWGPGSCCQCQ